MAVMTSIHPEGLPRESGRWSHVRALDLDEGRFLFVAGQTARSADGTPLPADFDDQFAVVYANLEIALASAGAGFEDVISLRTFVVRREDVARFGELRDARHAELFRRGEEPPNTLVLVAGLAVEAMLIEVEATAFVARASDPSRSSGRGDAR
jgi:enamine deaminase RidA (YjgF/YER057c/UK114 family)